MRLCLYRLEDISTKGKKNGVCKSSAFYQRLVFLCSDLYIFKKVENAENLFTG